MPRRAWAVASVGSIFLALALCACGGEEAIDANVPVGEPRPPAVRRVDPPAAVGSLAPNLTVAGGSVLLSWLEPLPEARHRLLLSRLEAAGWSEPVVVAEGEGFFANWADLPAVARSGDGSLVAHWLAKTGDATYAYSVFLARSVDGGASWAELGRLPDDDSPTEHGFVSWVPEGEGLRAFWLDGREMGRGGGMGLRTALVGETVGASELLDSRTCECCSTDAAMGAGGPLVVYRDRDVAEVRDVSVVRGGVGGWAAPVPAIADGWSIAGCPVNGPAVAADGDTAALAWFTAAGDRPRVRLALSADGGGTWGAPVSIDAEAPAGRVDVVLDGTGGAVVSWLAIEDGVGAVRVGRVAADGRAGEPLRVAVTGAGRSSGVPRLVRVADALYLAWVDTASGDDRIRFASLSLDALPAIRRSRAGSAAR